MSDPVLPADGGSASTIDMTLTPAASTDVRNIDMSRLNAGPTATNPNVMRVGGSTPGTATRQPDGSWTFAPDPPVPPPTSPLGPTGWTPAVASVARTSLFHGPGGLLATLATLGTIAIVGVALIGGPADGESAGDTPPAAATAGPLAATPGATLDEEPVASDPSTSTGAAEANRIVIEIVRSCLVEPDATEMGLVFEAVPGVELASIYQAAPGHPDYLFIPERVAESDVYTVTITATSGRHDGAKGRWAVDIRTRGVVPIAPMSIDGATPMWGLLASHGCGTIQEML